MGETLCETVQVTNLDLLEDALIDEFGWDKNFCKRLSDEDQKQGKSFKVVPHRGGSGHMAEDEVELYGGYKTKNKVIWKIDRPYIHNKKGQKAVYSGAAIARTPDGYLEYITDAHNIGGDSSHELSISKEITQKLVSKVFEKAQKKQHSKIKGIRVLAAPPPKWDETGEQVSGEFEVDEDDLANIPALNM